jgi:hypothetical protein
MPQNWTSRVHVQLRFVVKVFLVCLQPCLCGRDDDHFGCSKLPNKEKINTAKLLYLTVAYQSCGYSVTFCAMLVEGAGSVSWTTVSPLFWPNNHVA